MLFNEKQIEFIYIQFKEEIIMLMMVAIGVISVLIIDDVKHLNQEKEV